ncbi:nucleoside triphosphate pyrophosphohydrolase [Pseudoblastomonas halimionae]|uniref:Nucleoside triphosphate pyrophosphohydrolase n=1 Tax=Alteriqipengyuania halimionae TaxID=1926630 RepID=A0A6I4U3I6_9SPHN|nr:nucleoside triphosphate pyrophosphohydrolase [Alteriqipengyuania halimionae]MXP09493.1 nucleoside triphosphate pyrophosphohydrolase [Alteriqipengyuania halimionae]
MSSEQISRLLSIMARLRDPDSGCEWDLAQDFASIAPYTIEEAYEVSDAIERSDLHDLRGELGDLLLQVVFHARMAEEQGAFDFDDVARSISDKMEARHPHIFGDDTSGQPQERRWEELKARERAEAGAQSALDGIAQALPALMRAEKIQKRAARTGFDWPDTRGPADKLHEEIEELRAAQSPTHQAEEAGDLLFAAVNVVRAYGIDPEEALRRANAKFDRRFRAMESFAEADGKDFAELDLDAQEALWQSVKASER